MSTNELWPESFEPFSKDAIAAKAWLKNHQNLDFSPWNAAVGGQSSQWLALERSIETVTRVKLAILTQLAKEATSSNLLKLQKYQYVSPEQKISIAEIAVDKIQERAHTPWKDESAPWLRCAVKVWMPRVIYLWRRGERQGSKSQTTKSHNSSNSTTRSANDPASLKKRKQHDTEDGEPEPRRDEPTVQAVAGISTSMKKKQRDTANDKPDQPREASIAEAAADIPTSPLQEEAQITGNDEIGLRRELSLAQAVSGVESVIGNNFKDAFLCWEALQAPGSQVYFSGRQQTSLDGNRRLALLGAAWIRTIVVTEWYATSFPQARFPLRSEISQPDSKAETNGFQTKPKG